MKKIILLSFSFLIYSIIKTELSPHILGQHTNPVFVCTGIANGECFAHAIVENCKNGSFSEIYGIEENYILANHSQKFAIPKHINYCKAKNINYKVYQNNSILDLANIINTIDKPITFVLASQFPDWTYPKKQNYILQELDQVKKHHIKEHTILIDYIYFRNISLDSIKNKLLEINANYKFKLENGGHLGKEKNTILIAYLHN